MGHTLFISDLHLDRERPAIVNLFSEFLAGPAGKADALYILGDLFEYWIGDDDPVPGLESVMASLEALRLPLYFIHGNRDFLIGEQFAARVGCTLLPEAQIIDLYGEPTLIMHGDTLCTDDVAYQQFRAQTRNSEAQAMFLAKTLDERKAIAMGIRERSRQETSNKREEIMDVNQQAVEATLREHNVRRLIHGHTHRPATHEFIVDGASATRIVLGDWYEQGSVLRCDEHGCELSAV